MSASSTTVTAANPAVGSKRKVKEPTEAEVAQAALLESLFNAKNSTVLAKAMKMIQAREPAKKKAKKEATNTNALMTFGVEEDEDEEVNEDEAKSNKPAAFNPFVAAMDVSLNAVSRSTPTARTQNGAASFSTTKAPNLDLFYHLARGYSESDIRASLPDAWAENPETMMKVLCHARDCHGAGKGERLVVYHALMWLRQYKPKTYLLNILTILSHGYFKDILNMVEMIDAKIAGVKLEPKITSKPPTTKKGRGGKTVRGGRGGRTSTSASSYPVKGATIGAAMTQAAEAKKNEQKREAAERTKSKAQVEALVGPIGNALFELHILAEYLKADFIKLKAWRNAKKNYAMQEARLKKAETAAAQKAQELAALEAEKARQNAKPISSYILASGTAWFDVEDDVVEEGEIEDEDWMEVNETTQRVEKLEIKEDHMTDIPKDAVITQSTTAATTTPAAPVTSTTGLIEPPGQCFISLSAKYAPSERKHFASQAKRIAKILFASQEKDGKGPSGFQNAKHMQVCLKKYRTMLTTLRSHLMITERLACSQQWDRINFNAVPSKCHQLLKKAFVKHCGVRYATYLASLKKGVAGVKINVTGLAPHELVDYYLKGGALNDTVEEAWKALVAKTAEAGTFKGAISVVDVSGSMSGQPMCVAIAMGLLVAELCEGVYRGRCLTFHESPTWHTIEGATLREKVACLSKASWGGNTNLVKTFDLILSVAKQYNVKQGDLPQTLFIFSDMQFDQAVGGGATGGWMKTNYQVIKTKFEKAGYTIPNIVFWNLNGAINKDCPVQCDTQGCALMSGFSAMLLAVFLKQPLPAVIEPTPVAATPEEQAKANPLHPLAIMMNSLEPYTVMVDESER